MDNSADCTFRVYSGQQEGSSVFLSPLSLALKDSFPFYYALSTALPAPSASRIITWASVLPVLIYPLLSNHYYKLNFRYQPPGCPPTSILLFHFCSGFVSRSISVSIPRGNPPASVYIVYSALCYYMLQYPCSFWSRSHIRLT